MPARDARRYEELAIAASSVIAPEINKVYAENRQLAVGRNGIFENFEGDSFPVSLTGDTDYKRIISDIDSYLLEVEDLLM